MLDTFYKFLLHSYEQINRSKLGHLLFAYKYPLKQLKSIIHPYVRQAIDIDRERRLARVEIAALRERYETLTDRERVVLLGVIGGALNKQLAVELDTCERTIKTHRARMMAKLQARSLADLAAGRSPERRLSFAELRKLVGFDAYDERAKRYAGGD